MKRKTFWSQKPMGEIPCEFDSRVVDYPKNFMFQIGDQVVLLENYAAFLEGDSGTIVDIDYLRDLISVRIRGRILKCFGYRLQKTNKKKQHHPLTNQFL